MSKVISEEIKQKIKQLYNQGNMSDGMIAQAVGVSERTVRRYGKSVGLGQALPDTTRKASPAVVRPSPLPDQALDVTERPRPALPDSTAGQYRTVLPDNRKQRRCKRCGYTTDKKIKGACPGCDSGPFDSISVEIDSPDHVQLIEGNQKPEETEEPEKEDLDLQDHEESGDDNETNTKAVEEQQPEYEYECPKCHKEFNGVLERCPHCGTQLEESWECPKCHHRWYGSPDQCSKCKAKLQE